eukprot:augustus_masked-scaffold_3-processed-gene-3.65-mRNA-1 protein AED:0.15 eAED:0.24 QI:0/-1/0/1/-1/1/1/0/513
MKPVCLVDVKSVEEFLIENGFERQVEDYTEKIINHCFYIEKQFLRSLALYNVSLRAQLTEVEALQIIARDTTQLFLEHPSTAKRLPHLLLKALTVTAKLRTITLKPVEVSTSENLETSKVLVALPQKQNSIKQYNVEFVVLRHSKRTTICISSQAGCRMGCTFCATGSLGYEENLKSGEIIQQLFLAQRFLALTDPDLRIKYQKSSSMGFGTPTLLSTAEENLQLLSLVSKGSKINWRLLDNGYRKICNVVFMGMGEPLNNYSNVKETLRTLIHTSRFSLKGSKITVSTVGVIPKIKKLAVDFPTVSFALSLHAPNQQLRKKLIPTSTAYKLDRLMDSLAYYLEHSEQGSIFIEYILIAQLNESKEVAQELLALFDKFLQVNPQFTRNVFKVNLIPYNPIYNPKGFAKQYKAPSWDSVKEFRKTIMSGGFFCTIRTEMGGKINGACGQLALFSEKKNDLIDIEDFVGKKGKKDMKKVIKKKITKKPKEQVSYRAIELACFSSILFGLLNLAQG